MSCSGHTVRSRARLEICAAIWRTFSKSYSKYQPTKKSHHRAGRLGVVGLGWEWLFTANIVISGFFHCYPIQLPTCVRETDCFLTVIQRTTFESKVDELGNFWLPVTRNTTQSRQKIKFLIDFYNWRSRSQIAFIIYFIQWNLPPVTFLTSPFSMCWPHLRTGAGC